MKVHLFTDGGSRGNPGPGACAFAAVVEIGTRSYSDGRLIHKRSEYLGNCTNNEAEYNGLKTALKWARSRDFKDIMIHSDSQLMIRQLNGQYEVRSRRIIPLYNEVHDLLSSFRWRAVHHGREHRWISLCDSLLNEALDRR
ncbi:MAG: ribonuclease HI family protein [Thermoplasmatota archaeon]